MNLGGKVLLICSLLFGAYSLSNQSALLESISTNVQSIQESVAGLKSDMIAMGRRLDHDEARMNQ
jgi:outer membrane murein-binding lipoprotein Lpp